jgi:hypothetical protein
LTAVEQWRSYLQVSEFIIFTDQKSLTHLNDQSLNTVWQQRVFSKLLGLWYRIVYKKGSDSTAADALSSWVSVVPFRLLLLNGARRLFRGMQMTLKHSVSWPN